MVVPPPGVVPPTVRVVHEVLGTEATRGRPVARPAATVAAAPETVLPATGAADDLQVLGLFGGLLMLAGGVLLTFRRRITEDNG